MTAWLSCTCHIQWACQPPHSCLMVCSAQQQHSYNSMQQQQPSKPLVVMLACASSALARTHPPDQAPGALFDAVARQPLFPSQWPASPVGAAALFVRWAELAMPVSCCTAENTCTVTHRSVSVFAMGFECMKVIQRFMDECWVTDWDLIFSQFEMQVASWKTHFNVLYLILWPYKYCHTISQPPLLCRLS